MKTVNRRGILSLIGLAAGASVVPVVAAGAAALDTGRKVTHLPGGGMLIEGQKFEHGVELLGVKNLSLANNVIEGGVRAADKCECLAITNNFITIGPQPPAASLVYNIGDCSYGPIKYDHQMSAHGREGFIHLNARVKPV